MAHGRVGTWFTGKFLDTFDKWWILSAVLPSHYLKLSLMPICEKIQILLVAKSSRAVEKVLVWKSGARGSEPPALQLAL